MPILTKLDTTCRQHRTHPLTRAKDGAREWAFCGICESERARKFIDETRDPRLQDAFRKALYRP